MDELKKVIRAVAYFSYEEKGNDNFLLNKAKNDFMLKIEKTYGWFYLGCYADKCKPDKKYPLRVKRNQMLKDAENGKFDYVLTDSVLSLGENYADSLAVIMKLRKHRVYVKFESSGLDTSEEGSMEALKLVGTSVLEGSLLRSEYTKHGIRTQYARGEFRWSRLYGYRENENGEHVIVESEAEVVRRIYELYLNGAPMRGIKGVLEREGIPSPQGKEVWKTSAIKRILDNERYAGGVLLQKYINEEGVSGKSVRNDGSVVPQYMIWNHHAAIISREDFEQAARIRAEKRRNGRE